MQKNKALTLQIAGAAALAVLVGTSVFAESRHLGGTRGSSHPSFGGSIGRSAPRLESRSSGSRSFGSRGSTPRSATPRFGGPRSSAPRSVAPSWRGGSYRGGSSRGGVPFHGYNSGARFFGRGRIDRVVPYHGGYRVWLGGWGYPFFVPYRYYDPFRFRLGLFIGFNAFYDPLGYYSVYSPYYGYPPPAVVYAPAYRDDDYRDDNYSVSVVRGTVQSVELSRDTMWVNDDVSHKVVTVLMPPDRQLNRVRAGDFVEVSGDWKSDGVFDAHALDRFEPRR